MWKNIGFEQCLSFINCQLCPEGMGGRAVRPAITVSRMAGAGGRSIASKLAEILEDRVPVDCHWTVFDRKLIEQVLADHHLPKRIGQFMAENHRSAVADVIEELLGLHPPSWTLWQQTTETILHLAHLGHVILVGRGANIVTSKLENAYHVRLIGSLEKRVERVQQVYDLDHDRALEFIRSEDRGRRRYLKEHFDKDIDDPLLYHVVINTDRLGYENAARLIADEVIQRFHLGRRVETVAA